MADIAREQKLAAARKKLRQFRKKKEGTNILQSNNSDFEKSVPLDLAGESETSSRCSSVDLNANVTTDCLPISSDISTDSQIHVASISSDEPSNIANLAHNRPSQLDNINPISKENPSFVTSPHLATNNLLHSEVNPSDGRINGQIYDENVYSKLVNDHSICDEVVLNRNMNALSEKRYINDNTVPSTLTSNNTYLSNINNDQRDSVNVSVAGNESTNSNLQNIDGISVGLNEVVNNNAVITDTRVFNTVLTDLSGSGISAPMSETVPYQPVEMQNEELLPNAMDEYEGSVCSETSASVMTAIHVSGRDGEGKPVLKSSSESLRQLSLQLSGLMNDSEDHDNLEGTVLEPAMRQLEDRNSELAALLHQQTSKSQQQENHIIEMKNKISSLEAEMECSRSTLACMSGENSKKQEVEGIREQLQVHIQTIGILVAEKSELQTSVMHLKHSLSQKSGEVTELGGRLGASRQRVGELEAGSRESESRMANLTTARDTLTQDLTAVKSSQSSTGKLCDELRASVAELTERLSVKTEENDKLTGQFNDLRNQFAMSQLNVQQLRDGTSDDLRAELERVKTIESVTSHKLQEKEASLIQSQKDNTNIITQYQQYTIQFTTQIQQLQQQLQEVMNELNVVSSTKKDIEEKLRELQAQMSLKPDIDALINEKETLLGIVSQFELEKKELSEKHNCLVRDNGQLSKLVEQQSNQLESLEVACERNNTQSVDTTQLLAALQSDKVAASRALTQNKELKEQLFELQNGLVMMTNKKLELTEKLERELHVKKGLQLEISQLGEQMSLFRQQMLEKDRETTLLQENCQSLGKQLMDAREVYNKSSLINLAANKEAKSMYSNDHNHDHDHAHAHAHDHDHDHDHTHGNIKNEIDTNKENDLMDKLQLQLKEANILIENLTRKNNELMARMRTIESDGSTTDQSTINGHHGTDYVEGSTILQAKTIEIEKLTVKVQMLETERNQLILKLNEVSIIDHTKPQLDIPTVKYDELKTAHEALAKRFARSMEDVAQLSDDKQRLEHLIQQLQLETDTIGDYITIYQFQRGVMKQQAKEREEEVKSLQEERKEMLIKLQTLQELVSTLGWDRVILPDFISGVGELLSPPQINGEVDATINDDVTDAVKNKDLNKTSSEKNNIEKTLVNNLEKDNVYNNGTSIDNIVNNTNDTLQSDNSTVDMSTNKNDSSIITEDSASADHSQSATKNSTVQTKSATVQRILDLISEMESTSHTEHGHLQRCHSCALCSGKLITV